MCENNLSKVSNVRTQVIRVIWTVICHGKTGIVITRILCYLKIEFIVEEVTDLLCDQREYLLTTTTADDKQIRVLSVINMCIIKLNDGIRSYLSTLPICTGPPFF